MSLTSLTETIEWFAYVKLGEVEQTVTPYQRGRVRFMATSWFARFPQPNGQKELVSGTTVRFFGRQGLTLLVMPVDGNDIQSEVLVSDRAESNQSGWARWVQQVGSVFSSLLN